MTETKKKAKLSIEEKIARREEMAQKNSNELKVLKRKLSEQKRKERDSRIYEKGAVFESIFKESIRTYSYCPFVTASASCFPISWAFSKLTSPGSKDCIR